MGIGMNDIWPQRVDDFSTTTKASRQTLVDYIEQTAGSISALSSTAK
jgi:hypothetical protein